MNTSVVAYDDYELSLRSNSFNSSSKPSSSSSRKRFSLNGVASTWSCWLVVPSKFSSTSGGIFFKRSSAATVPVPST